MEKKAQCDTELVRRFELEKCKATINFVHYAFVGIVTANFVMLIIF